MQSPVLKAAMCWRYRGVPFASVTYRVVRSSIRGVVGGVGAFTIDFCADGSWGQLLPSHARTQKPPG